MGHSAGGHLVALVATDSSYLAAHGLDTRTIRCTASLDTEGYDIPAHLANHDPDAPTYLTYLNAFGDDPDRWADASPIIHVGDHVNEFLLVSRGSERRRAIVAAFAGALRDAGVPTTVVDMTGYSHAEVNSAVGAPGDTVLTPALDALFARCLAP
jgi:acetyl esterase/lipase